MRALPPLFRALIAFSSCAIARNTTAGQAHGSRGARSRFMEGLIAPVPVYLRGRRIISVASETSIT